MMTNSTKRFLSAFIAVIMLLGIAGTAAASDITAGQEQTQSYTYTAPESPMEVSDNIVTASAHRAASPVLGMMGVNAVSGFGMINGGAPADLAEAQKSAAVGIWGSSLNSSPDPYYWNYFYNYYAEANGLPLSEDALVNANVAASPGAADSTLLEEYGNVSVSLSKRPEILVGTASGNDTTDTNGYDEQLATIHSFTPDSPYYQEGDETYSPKLVSYQMTTIREMIWSVKQLALAIDEVKKETGKTTRYGDPLEIAADYEEYVYGVIAYVNAQLEAKGLSKKNVAVVTAINEDGTYALADSFSMSATSLVRAYEYTMTTTDSLVDTIGGTTATLDQLLTADAIITINNQNVTQTAMLESFGEKVYEGILLTNTPSTLYGMTMNSVENAMGYAYVIGCIYSDVIDIDPVEFCAYFYQHFWHITDRQSLAEVVKTNFATTILPRGVGVTLSASYSEDAIQAKIDAGIAYLKANPEKFKGAVFEKIGMAYSAAASTTKGIMNDTAFTIAEAYLIHDNNYLQLRSIAKMLKGTAAEFNVDYIDNYVVIETGKPFTGDSNPFSGKAAVLPGGRTTTVKIDGELVTLEAYLIEDSNYVQLRHVAEALSGTNSRFDVQWDEEAKTMIIVPGADYSGQV